MKKGGISSLRNKQKAKQAKQQAGSTSLQGPPLSGNGGFAATLVCVERHAKGASKKGEDGALCVLDCCFSCRQLRRSSSPKSPLRPGDLRLLDLNHPLDPNPTATTTHPALPTPPPPPQARPPAEERGPRVRPLLGLVLPASKPRLVVALSCFCCSCSPTA